VWRTRGRGVSRSAAFSPDPERAERKLATVLFPDLVRSTEFGASQDPERTRTMLGRFYDAMAEEVPWAGGDGAIGLRSHEGLILAVAGTTELPLPAGARFAADAAQV
jgi:class 3 adenylate cyclase